MNHWKQDSNNKKSTWDKKLLKHSTEVSMQDREILQMGQHM